MITAVESMKYRIRQEHKQIDLRLGDSRAILKSIPSNSIDSCVTDPPYELVSIVKRFGKENSAPAKFGTDGRFTRASKGFMGKEWDGTGVQRDPLFWREVYRVLKPGGHVLAFGGTRTYHRLTCAIEDAGFEIRDCIQWLYGSGFPKSHNIGNRIDRMAGYGPRGHAICTAGTIQVSTGKRLPSGTLLPKYKGKTEEAKRWDGWGTALKPANEPICLARKPLSEKTVAANVLKWGTGALNIDACRVGTEPAFINVSGSKRVNGIMNPTVGTRITSGGNGRWPTNVILDEKAGKLLGEPSRFFYCPKANKKERNLGLEQYIEEIKYIDDGRKKSIDNPYQRGQTPRVNNHPTVKPIALMKYLITLITPPCGTVLDPFMGSGSTGIAATQGGWRFIGIELDPEYFEIARRRITHAVQHK